MVSTKVIVDFPDESLKKMKQMEKAEKIAKKMRKPMPEENLKYKPSSPV